MEREVRERQKRDEGETRKRVRSFSMYLAT
jgi:hypothetical protein